MKIKKERNARLLMVSSIAIVILISIGVFAYFKIKTPASNKDVNSDSTSSKTPQRTESDYKQAAELKSDPSKKTNSSNTDTPIIPAPADGDNRRVVQITTSTDRSNDVIFIRGGVNYPVRSGNCSATLVGPSGQKIIKDTVILANPASADCKTINFPISELASGEWSYTLEYQSDEYKGVSDSVEFSV